MQAGDVVHYSDYAVPAGPRGQLTVFPPWLAVVHEIQLAAGGPDAGGGARPIESLVLNFGRLTPQHGAIYQRFKISGPRALEPEQFQGYRLWPRVARVVPGEIPLLDEYPELALEIVVAWNRSFAEESDPDHYLRLSLHLHQVNGIPPGTAELEDVWAQARRHYATVHAHGNFERITAATAQTVATRLEQVRAEPRIRCSLHTSEMSGPFEEKHKMLGTAKPRGARTDGGKMICTWC